MQNIIHSFPLHSSSSVKLIVNIVLLKFFWRKVEYELICESTAKGHSEGDFNEDFNIDKSHMKCSKNVGRRDQARLSKISGIRKANNLGAPLLQGRVNWDMFKPILENISRKLASRKNRLLNKAERICLAQSVILALPMYTMQILWKVCTKIDSMTCNFVWSNIMA
ncbi:hypothetical protein RJT34_10435 [Clitoria ternatea]|uniref:Uncharacterized protein n=1 Tax=Clitoria ternatea TaxID=43366 RepID=A0AAN9PV57_CLITE